MGIHNLDLLCTYFRQQYSGELDVHTGRNSYKEPSNEYRS